MTDPQVPHTVPAEDLAPPDDAIIGRAFWWSLAVITVLVAGLAATWWAASRPEPTLAAGAAPRRVPVQPAAKPQPPALAFTDMTSGSGVDFVHYNGAAGEKLLPETMGGGVALFDYDGDGDQDVLFVSAAPWPEQAGTVEAPPSLGLYRNDGDWTFTNITEQAGLLASFYGTGVAVGDYDNDGDPDLHVTGVHNTHFFRNDGGVYREMTAEAGLVAGAREWSSSAGFFDYDNDGDLDLFVCNYVAWFRDIDFAVNFQLTGIGRAYGPPTGFEGTHPRLYRNNGDGTFSDISQGSGVRVYNPDTEIETAKALGATFVDIDQDGWIDVFVANDTVANFVFRNTGHDDPRFVEVGQQTGVAYSRMGDATGAMGIDAARYDADDTLAVGMGNFANEMSSLYTSQGDPWQFIDESISEGIGARSRLALTFGLFFFDADLDGRLDLLQANGHLEDEINKVQPTQHYRQSAQLFWNAGPGTRDTFVEVPAASLGDLAKPIVGRSAAYADLDGDGDLDVVLTQVAGPPLLLRNDLDTTKRTWLRVKAVGDGKTVNRDAIGTRLVLTTGGIVQRRTVMPTRSYLAQVELPVTFGVPAGATDATLTITWTDGTTQQLPVTEFNTTLTVSRDMLH